jgi:hypothetical protein
MGLEAGMGAVLRWDYYKDWVSVMKNEDDLLNVIAQIVKKHPQTEDGKKVYGVGALMITAPGVYSIPWHPFMDTRALEVYAPTRLIQMNPLP